MISLTNNLIVARPGRCGGREFAERFGGLNQDVVMAHLGIPRHLHHKAHIPLHIYRQHLPKRLWNAFHKVILVRHPYDRVRSTLAYRNATQRRPDDPMIELEDLNSVSMCSYIYGLPVYEKQHDIHVVHMESYEEDCEKLKKELGLREVAKAGKRNAVLPGLQKQLGFEKVTGEMRDWVDKNWGEDFDWFPEYDPEGL